MFLKENILLAVAGLKANKMRAFLTMLGIIIGISSVIAIVSIGNAVTVSVSDTFSGMGASNIYVYVSKNDSDDMGISGTSKIDDTDLLSPEQIDQIHTKFSDEISAIALSEGGSTGKAEDGHNYANVSLDGVNPGYGDVQNVTMISGRFLQDRDISGNRRVAVVSDKLVSNMFKENTDPLGKELDVTTDNGQETYRIVGVYKHQNSGNMGSGSLKDIRTEMYIPISVVKETADNQNYSSFQLKPKGVENAEAFTQKLDAYVKKMYQNNSKYTCTAYNIGNQLSSFTSVMNTLSVAVAAIAAIALFVGGIGVMNIMLVSVTERTREIGTRKALGARGSYIRMQFIVESIIICLIGGIIGILVGIGLAAVGVGLIGSAMPQVKMKLALSIPTILISVAFSMLIGVFFGYYPAKKASQLDPIEALRYE